MTILVAFIGGSFLGAAIGGHVGVLIGGLVGIAFGVWANSINVKESTPIMNKNKLDERPARTDLTSRECSKIIGATIGGLADMSTVKEIREAVRWWAENEEAWEALKSIKRNKS